MVAVKPCDIEIRRVQVDFEHISCSPHFGLFFLRNSGVPKSIVRAMSPYNLTALHGLHTNLAWLPIISVNPDFRYSRSSHPNQIISKYTYVFLDDHTFVFLDTYVFLDDHDTK